jgi:hypothetical protein
MDIGKNLKLISASYIVTIAGDTIRNYSLIAMITNLSSLVGLDHFVLFGHLANPMV